MMLNPISPILSTIVVSILCAAIDALIVHLLFHNIIATTVMFAVTLVTAIFAISAIQR